MKASESILSLEPKLLELLILIQKSGPLTKNDLIGLTGQKLTTLNRAMKDLENRGLVEPVAVADSSGGRRPCLYDVCRKGYYLIGIDVSRTYAQVIIANLKFESVIEERFQGETYAMAHMPDELPFLIKDLLKTRAISEEDIVAIGIGVVQVQDQASLASALRQKMDIPVVIDNGANAAVIYEHYIGSGKTKQNVSYVHCGVGLRTGVVSRGQLIRFINESEDALGRMIMDVSPDQQIDLETLISINTLTKQLNTSARLAQLTNDFRDMSFAELCALAEQDVQGSGRIITEAARYFGAGLTNFIRLMNPQVMILSGPLIQASPLFYQMSVSIVCENLKVNGKAPVLIKGGHYDMNSIAMGAAVMSFLDCARMNTQI